MEFKYIIENSEYKTVKDVLKNYFFISSRLLLKLKRNKKIFLNNVYCNNLAKNISVNDTVSFSLDQEEDNSNIVATNIPLNIVYEDDCLLIINKQPNVAIHPSMLHYEL